MSRISTPAVDTATGATAALFARIKKAAGRVPNTFAAIGALQPAALGAILDADAVLAAGSLDKQDVETVKLAVSAATGCDYCVAAHSLLSKLAGLSADAIRKIREGEPTGNAKRDALAVFARTLVMTSGTLGAEEVTAIKAAGYTDRQLVEISLAVALTIFTNVFNRINDTEVDFAIASVN
jgi:uncharacterized peroxidase-related enzyme